MTNILAHSPDAILIDLPGSGLAALCDGWDLDKAYRASGHIPTAWPDHPKIAVVRHPETRFLAALQQAGTTDENAAADGTAPLPGLTVTRALDILADDNIGYDGTSDQPEAVLKNQILPQTHPFNCLALADHLLKYETLSDNLARLKADIGLQIDAQSPANETHNLQIPDAEKQRFRTVFEADFRQLGYDPEGKVALDQPSTPTIWSSWPSLFDNQRYGPSNLDRALPAPDCNLALFLAETVPGPTGPTWTERRPNLRKHFLMLQPEFAGKSRLAHLLACSIVTIRRSEGAHGLALFFRIWETHGPEMGQQLTARWLVAVCDTLADHGRAPEQRAIGLCGSLLLNSVKLFETERRDYYPKRPWPPRKRFARDSHLFDGLWAYWTKGGDLIDNMRDRVAAIAELDAIAGPFMVEVFRRVEANDTSYCRLARLAGDDPRPRLRGWRHRLLQSLIGRYL